ncbi:MAG: helix-turn-helix domain-containing protein [Azoarcus sp.]|jgi:predicted DNA-binding mobile mystery protein A|nr:helix-turn-helix domain-containing protein [Azoarcus sp.]
MISNLRILHLDRVDSALTRWRKAALPARPPIGWIRSIRDALGMSSAALARRLGITDSAVRKLESAESCDAITLGTLRRIAAGLDCELQYALVPRQSLHAMRVQQAMRIARKQIQSVECGAAPELVAAAPESPDAQIGEIAHELLLKPGKVLWQ